MILLEGLLFFYVFLMIILPLRWKWYFKGFLSLLVLLIAFKIHLVFWLSDAAVGQLELPENLIIMATWCFAVLLVFFVGAVSVKVLALCWYLHSLIVHKNLPLWIVRLQNKLNVIILLIAIVISSVGFYYGCRLPQIREETLYFDNLPPEADGMTIAIAADLHIDRITGTENVKRITDIINAAKPDVIFLAGDMVEGKTSMHQEFLLPLKELSAPYGVFGVNGNHEYYSNYREWLAAFQKTGIKMLLNDHVVINDKKIVIAGVTDPIARVYGYDSPNVKASLKDAPQGMFSILLAHQPRVIGMAKDAKVDLQISGHTHGGIVWGINHLLSWFNQEPVAGKYQIGDTQLYVSRGSGIWSAFPVRLGVNNEITLLTLRRRD